MTKALKNGIHPYFKLVDKTRPRAAGEGPFTPSQLAARYKWPAGLPAGGTIGIVELGGGYAQSDVLAAFTAWDLPLPIITDVSVDGTTNSPTPGSDSPDRKSVV